MAISPKGRALLGGAGEFRFRRDMIRTKMKRERTGIVQAIVVNPRFDALLIQLKTLRRILANERHVPAYVIFSDRTLNDMAERMPLTKWEFGEVHGVGAAKQEQFAEIFVTKIRDFVRENSAA